MTKVKATKTEQGSSNKADVAVKGKKPSKVDEDKVPKTEKPAKAPKAIAADKAVKSKKKSEGEVAESSSKKSAKPKVAKKQVPLSVDKNGLSFSPGRIRRLLLDVVFNRRYRVADKELKDHHKALLEASNLKEGYLSYHEFSTETHEYLRELFNAHLETERSKYERKTVKELLNKCPKDDADKRIVPEALQALLDARKQHLKDNPNGDLAPVYEKYDKKFYSGFNEAKRVYGLAGKEAFQFYRSLISRDKVRMNTAGNLRLTCFLELVLRHLVAQASVACVRNGKSTINLGNMSTSLVDSNYLFSLVSNLGAWNSAVAWHNNGRPMPESPNVAKKVKGKKAEEPEPEQAAKSLPLFVNVEALNPGTKFRSNSYVVDICKNVSRELIANPPAVSYPDAVNQQNLNTLYETVKISKEFRVLCNQIVLELVHSIGNILHVIINTGRDHTVTAATVNALVQTYHVVFNQTDRLADTFDELDRMTATYTETQSKLSASRPKRNNLGPHKAKVATA